MFNAPPGVVDLAPSDSPPADEFKAVLVALSHELPVAFHVDVRIEEIDAPYLGLTTMLPNGLLIQIERRQNFNNIVDVLIHEWAHAVAWPVPQQDVHDEIWGALYSRAYRIARRVLDAADEEQQAPSGCSAK